MGDNRVDGSINQQIKKPWPDYLYTKCIMTRPFIACNKFDLGFVFKVITLMENLSDIYASTTWCFWVVRMYICVYVCTYIHTYVRTDEQTPCVKND